MAEKSRTYMVRMFSSDISEADFVKLMETEKPQVRAYTYQLEKGEGTGKEHYQAVVQYKHAQPIKNTQTRFRVFESGISVYCKPVIDIPKAIEYCQKEDTRIGESIQVGEFDYTGKRNDLLVLEEALRACYHINEVIQHEDAEVRRAYAKHSKYAREYKASLPMDEYRTPLTEFWIDQLREWYNKPAHPREILWVFDPIGNAGKSEMTKELVSKGAFLAPSSHKHALYGYSKSMAETVVWDLPRDSSDHVPYGAIEAIKTGVYTSAMYEAPSVSRFKPCRVVVFANYLPDKRTMSQDRWTIWELEKTINPENGEEWIYARALCEHGKDIDINEEDQWDYYFEEQNWDEKEEAYVKDADAWRW